MENSDEAQVPKDQDLVKVSEEGHPEISENHPIPKSAESPLPFPWPMTLAFLLPVGMAAVLLWFWSQDDYALLLRVGWVSLCSLIPGLSVMILLGSIIQVRKRPLLSILSILLSVLYLVGSWWAVQWIVQNVDKFF